MQISNHPTGSYENPLAVPPEELRQIKIQNLRGQMQSEITSVLGTAMDEGLTDEKILAVFRGAVSGAYDWLKKD